MTREAAYRRTEYRAGEVVVRVGRRSISAEAWMARHHAHEAWFLGAWNPLSRKMPQRWNDAAHARLRRDTRHFEEGEGVLGRWHERMLLVAADGPRIRRLGRRYRQAAVVRVPRRAPARLVWLRPCPASIRGSLPWTSGSGRCP